MADTPTLAERVRDLERRVAALESKRLRTTQLDEASNMLSATPPRVGVANSAHEQEQVTRAEQLFQQLLQQKRLISYSGAYRRVIGPYDVWRNAVHPAEIIRVALRTVPRAVGQHHVRLDSLIVGKETRRPAKGHYASAAYSEDDWIRTFGTWPLLE